MKKNFFKIAFALMFLFISIQKMYSQEQSRFKVTLHSEFNNQKSILTLNSVTYTLGNNPTTVDVKTLDTKDRVYLFASGAVAVNKELLKMFEPKTQNIKGYIEMVDGTGKLSSRKIEFQDATYSLSENFTSDYDLNPSTFSVSISANDLVIDGVSIFKK